MKKRALAMSGGANKGAYQLGVLKSLMGERSHEYDIITGISVGALNAAGLGMTKKGQPRASINWLIRFWLNNVDDGVIWRRHFPLGMIQGLFKDSLFDSNPLQRLVKKEFDHDRISNCGRLISVGAVSLTTGELRFVDNSSEEFLPWLLASSAYPLAFSPIRSNGQLWTDGGVTNITPIGEAVRLGADEIDVIMTSDPFKIESFDSDNPNLLSIGVRTLDLMTTQIMKHDLQITGLKNDLAEFKEKYRHVKINLFIPTAKLSDDPFDFSVKSMEVMIDQGYDDADNIFKKRFEQE